ncbi:MAG: acetylxylan esterase [Candidatus Lokiarchaeota archaeon]|nr:acetylxylan esterase [Candidatus Lokiarchaeota archaeon]
MREAQVPAYTLPDPLVCLDGTPVKDAATWTNRRRPEILALYRKHVYGRSPPAPDPKAIQYNVASKAIDALKGKATRKEVDIALTKDQAGSTMRLLVYLPNAELQRSSRCPVFLGLNFWGNHTINADPGISLNDKWSRCPRKPARARGLQSGRWQAEYLIKHGYGLATAYYGDVVLDHPDKAGSGVQPRYFETGQAEPAADAWGAIGAWAWGLSRAMDYLVQDPDVDAGRVVVTGHSRLGKTALWAGAQDQRFAMVISNESGCGGARLFRRYIGENIKMINKSFPHWFCGNFKAFNDREAELPVDQHMLVALAAPRPAYVASAQQDLGADPVGEFMSTVHATPVYRLFGLDGMPATGFPGVNNPVSGILGYHMRSGRHDVRLYDWEQYIKFADMHLEHDE